ncbi:amidohydrolase family protein [Cryobacterium sp. SO2]|uniref:amidohydrolase family protein n=1 Tax=Cryobacterium sp. SO2 TaxID=1897060 RepID=UPI00223D981B|nr:amidohydrolase family protein [Cryobacterium sp. SO2]WEO76315.1 amidohydrolase family protein [Cryobacterium sp. SO2]
MDLLNDRGLPATGIRADTRPQLHTAPWLVPVSREPIRDGAVLVTDGRISAVGTATELLGDLRRNGTEFGEHAWEGVLMPGHVNAHSHLQYTCMADVGQGVYAGFEDWSRAFQVVYEEPHDWGASAADGLAIALAAGTTAISDIVTDTEAFEVLKHGQMHGIAYWELMSWLTDEWMSRGRSETIARLGTAPHDFLGLSPHAPYSLDTEVIRDLSTLSEELGVRRHMHLAESAWEAEYTLSGTGQLADQWRNWGYSEFAVLRAGGTQRRPVAYAESIGALGPDCHIAHGIYADAEDRAILRRTHTAVALCPRSNAVIGLDEAPVAAYLREGNRIAVGTDSLSSTPSLDLMGDVAALYALARAQGYAETDLHARLLHAATLGGAVAMGMETGDHRIGSLDVGALADFAVLDTLAPTAHDVVAALVEAGDGHNLATIISGDIRWQRTI